MNFRINENQISNINFESNANICSCNNQLKPHKPKIDSTHPFILCYTKPNNDDNKSNTSYIWLLWFVNKNEKVWKWIKYTVSFLSLHLKAHEHYHKEAELLACFALEAVKQQKQEHQKTGSSNNKNITGSSIFHFNCVLRTAFHYFINTRSFLCLFCEEDDSMYRDGKRRWGFNYLYLC